MAVIDRSDYRDKKYARKESRMAIAGQCLPHGPRLPGRPGRSGSPSTCVARGPGRRAARGSAVLVVQGLRVHVHPLTLLPVLPGPVQVGALPRAAVEHSTGRVSGLPSGLSTQLQPPPTGRTPCAPAMPGTVGAPCARLRGIRERL